MKIMNFRDYPTGFFPESAVTIGNFDGVHVGHREIIRNLLEEAEQRRVPSVVITFDPHPREVIYEGEVVPAIIPFSERARLIEKIGVDYLAKVDFTMEFAEQTAEDFVRDLVDRMNPKVIIIGHDFRFGKGREGDEAFLREKAEEFGFDVASVPPVEVEGKTVHSTDIRRLIASGKLKRARKFLGEAFHIEGDVVHGHGRGKDLGFATANLKWDAKLLPPDGVYACVAEWNGDVFPAVVNIGTNPTFDDVALSLEAHVMGFDGDLYGKRIRLAFYRRLRGEIKFKSVTALVDQIKQDVKKAKEELRNETDPETFARIEGGFERVPG